MVLDIKLAGLILVGLIIFIVPFISRPVEKNLEVFFLIMGFLAATISGVWHRELVAEALVAPLKITLAVLIAGLIFHFLRSKVHKATESLLSKIPLALFFFSIPLILGLASSLISAIIASLVLVEMVNSLKLSRQNEINLVVLSCFSIGLGAALTPLGEPLSIIAISKLKADFFYLARLLGIYIFSGILAVSFLSLFLLTRKNKNNILPGSLKESTESLSHVFFRALKVYIFVMALIILGAGFMPIVENYFVKVSAEALYWINLSSAVLDNATLTAAEIGPALSEKQITSALLGLIISGGILIPGNIPNIISAGRLKISMKEWAKIGVPLGMSLMILYFFLLKIYF